MNRTALWTLALPAAACVAGLATAALLDVGAASAHPASHTIHLTTTQLQDKIVKDVDIAVDKDTAQHGSITGYDVSSCKVNFSTHVATCDLGVARSNGLLFVHARVNVNDGTGHGHVLGGTRAFKGATGTVRVKGKHVTIVYSG